MNEELKVIISAEISKLKKGISEAKRGIENFSDEVKKQSKNIDGTMQKLGDSIGSAIKKGAKVAVAAVGTIVTAIAGITTTAVKSYADYE